MMITARQNIMTAPGDRCIFVPESSLNLVNPPCPEGIVILLSAIKVYFKTSIIYLSELW